MLSRSDSFFVLLGLCMAIQVQGKIHWNGPDTVYIGFPGVSAERYAFLGKYCTYFEAYTGESICTKSINILDPRKTYVVKFCEIVDPAQCSWFQRYLNGFFRQKTWERQIGARLMTPARFGYSVMSYGVDRSKVSMGQSCDVTSIKEQLDLFFNCLDRFGFNFKFAWIAYSRGVAGLLRYLGTSCPRERMPHALVLEGGIDSISHFLCHMFDTHVPVWAQGKHKPYIVLNALWWGFKQFYAPRYENEWSEHTLLLIARIPSDIPVLLVTSLGDELVSYRSTLRMYRAFKNARKGIADNVHLLILNKARHSHYVDGVNNQLDRDRYQRCVHAFYKKYGLAYNEKLAAEGEEIFVMTNQIDEVLLLKGSCCDVCNVINMQNMVSSFGRG